MKKTFLLLAMVAALFVPERGVAQRAARAHHELSTSLGGNSRLSSQKFFPTSSWEHSGDLYDLYETRYHDVECTPYFQIAYNYLLNRWINFGGSLGISHVWAEKITPVTAEKLGDKHLTGICLMPHVKLVYINNPHFKLYSAVGGGIQFKAGRDCGESVSVSEAAYEIVPAGATFGGEMIYGLAEIAVGSKVRGVHIGLGYRF